MNVNDFKTFVEFLLRKSQSGGNPTPAQFNLALEQGYIAAIMMLYGNTKTYQPGRPVPLIAWEQNQRITDDLNFLIANYKMKVDSEGKLLIPDGVNVTDFSNQVVPTYMHLSAITHEYVSKDRDDNYVTRDTDVDVIKHSERGSVFGGDIAKPTKRHPSCIFYNGYIDVRPKNLKSVQFTYLRQPTIPKWAYTVENDRPVYDSDKSIDIETTVEMRNDIILKTLTFLGMSAREIGIINISEQLQQKGL